LLLLYPVKEAAGEVLAGSLDDTNVLLIRKDVPTNNLKKFEY
jgi:hypothetical protein